MVLMASVGGRLHLDFMQTGDHLIVQELVIRLSKVFDSLRNFAR